MNKKLLAPLSIIALTAFITACGGGNEETTVTTDPVEVGGVIADGTIGADLAAGGQDEVEDTHPLAGMHAVLANFPVVMPNDDPIVPGGTLRFAIDATGPNAGFIGGAVWWITNDDAMFAGPGWFNTSIFSVTEERTWGDHGIATYELDLDNMRMVITQNYFPNWHDGVPLTLSDLVFAYEVIAHPDYDGLRWNLSVQGIQGIMAYNAGEADYISGMILSDDNHTLTIYFDTISPAALHFGLWSTPKPRHVFENIPVSEMRTSDPVMVNPIGWGPFIVQNIVPGESIHYVYNPDFFLGRPVLDAITMEIIHPDLIPEAMTQGLFDIARFPLGQFPYFMEPTNFTYVGELVGLYNSIPFIVGTYDEENNRVVPDPSRIVYNVYLRRAMAYATDELAITTHIWHGLRFPATSVVTPIHQSLLDTTLTGFPYNPARAIEILDEAGFIDIDGDGFRETPDGEQMTLTWGIWDAPGNDITAAAYIQNWADVGIRVELFGGGLQDFTSLGEMFSFDGHDGEIDIAWVNWNPGFDPNPAGRWGHSRTNRSRFINDAMEDVLNRMNSVEAFDLDYFQELMNEYQRLFNYYVPAILNNWRIELWAVGNNVSGFRTDAMLPNGNQAYSTNFVMGGQAHLIGFTE